MKKTGPDYTRYEAEKKRLASECTSYIEYERKIKELAKKYDI